MANFTTTRIWDIDGKFFIADTIEEAIALYKEYDNRDSQPHQISAVHTNSTLSVDWDYIAVIRKNS